VQGGKPNGLAGFGLLPLIYGYWSVMSRIDKPFTSSFTYATTVCRRQQSCGSKCCATPCATLWCCCIMLCSWTMCERRLFVQPAACLCSRCYLERTDRAFKLQARGWCSGHTHPSACGKLAQTNFCFGVFLCVRLSSCAACRAVARARQATTAFVRDPAPYTSGYKICAYSVSWQDH
jgi:hypothetical protein